MVALFIEKYELAIVKKDFISIKTSFIQMINTNN